MNSSSLFFTDLAAFLVEILEYNEERSPLESMEEKVAHIRYSNLRRKDVVTSWLPCYSCQFN